MRWQHSEAVGQLFIARFDAVRSGPSLIGLRYTLYDERGAALGSGQASVLWDAAPRLPLAFAMGRASPNPASRGARIAYQLPQRAQVRLEVYNIAGQRVATLIDGPTDAGYHAVEWDLGGNGGRVANGVYFIKLDAGNAHAIQKLTVIR